MQSGSTTLTQYGLPETVQLYDTDQTTVIKKSVTTYNLDSAYTSRRIIGLPSMTEAWGKNDQTNSLEYVSKMTYNYDEGDFSDSGLNQNISPVQHDSANYGASFVTGRGLLTSTTRWDVTTPTNAANAITSSVKYNTAGAVVAQITPWDGTQTRTTRIGYADNWNAAGLPANTYAYPTTLTDPAGASLGDPAHSSQVKYRYDIGANVWAQSPAPAGNTVGKTTERFFDSLGRLQKDLIVNTGAYMRYEYPTNGIQSKVFSTIIDTNNNGADSADEVLAESWFDGSGRVRKSRTEHPGSVGGFAATLAEYDLLGRTKRTTVPTEVDLSWNPAGDDYRGMNGSDYIWLWNRQEYS